ncbi:hypothetical protein P7L53_05485 [Thermoleptolyngbya sichuanensis XZ-Cy5]|uniref:hypothetical protein n=1 Tax=Thermoleptolyngbya sichuanensis TaxID=2885951 RepID=UPI00240D11AD|nr:hypothetical protein [Thermoleptolyngbya sichuanensis]MDG2615693.1 hypothetical protein [Thermoleptolyngbya sichuanensis XZ-Cy5]
MRRSLDSAVWLPVSPAGLLKPLTLHNLTQTNQADILMKVLRGEWFYGVDTAQRAAGT